MRDLVSFVVFVDDDQKYVSFVSSYLLFQIIVLTKLALQSPTIFKLFCSRDASYLNNPLMALLALVINQIFLTPLDLSRRNPFHPVKEEDSLLNVCEILAKGVHRVPVVDAEGKVVNIVSQSTIIQFINSHVTNVLRISKELD